MPGRAATYHSSPGTKPSVSSSSVVIPVLTPRVVFGCSGESEAVAAVITSRSELPVSRSVVTCALKTSTSVVKVTYDDEGNPCVHYPGDYNILVPGHRDIEYRKEVVAREGVDTQVLSFTTPGVHVEPP